MIRDYKIELIHSFLNEVKRGNISNEKMKKLYEIVIGSKATEKQKERFVMYYKLVPGQFEEYNFSKLARIKGCAPTAIRHSVVRVRGLLINTTNEQEQLLVELMKGTL